MSRSDHGLIFSKATESGALYSVLSKPCTGGSSTRGATTYPLGLDANKSSSVYQDGAKVKPLAFTYKIWNRKF